ncbi:MAG: hypothetical protein WC107_02475 [Patescibacteria group bacterium]
MEKDLLYQKILNESEKDNNIIGFVLVAGRGKGFSTEYSDYDTMMIVADGKEDQYKEQYKNFNDTCDVYVKLFSLSEFEKYAEWGSDFEWDRYNFAHLKAQIDKTGEIQKIINEKGKLPEGKIREIVSFNLGCYINSYHRAVKNHRDKNEAASHFDAAESIPLLLSALFALEGRMRPYNKFLEWELEKYPLAKIPWDGITFFDMLRKIIDTGDIKTQKEIFNQVKNLFCNNGYKDEINEWNCYYMG